jgi:hypothetical protein
MPSTVDRQHIPLCRAGRSDNYIKLKFDYPSYTSLNLTLLMDPRGHVHATTGLLPTATIELPAEFYAAALSRMAVTFRAGRC